MSLRRFCLCLTLALAALTAASCSNTIVIGSSGASASTTGGQGGGGGGDECHTDSECNPMKVPCESFSCVAGSCVANPDPDGSSCDDGLNCTAQDACFSGQCSGVPIACPSDACNSGMCSEAANGCVYTPVNDGGPCGEDACVMGGVCSSGQCVGGQPADCSFLDGPCTVGTCQPNSGCVAAPINDGGACDDGLFCTSLDTCMNGICHGGGGFPCADPGGCSVAACDEVNHCGAAPAADGTLCDDANTCTANTVCKAGICSGGSPSNEGAACDDHSACTTGDVCTMGVCAGVGPAIYFADDFHDASKGWLLGPEWQIGPAKASMGGAFGDDPAQDHSPSGDNGVAGVVIGGNASTMVHPASYLESPPFDTSNAAGSVIFGFYRWLNSDYDPFMHDMIEVWNGVSWVTLWKSGNQPIQDAPPVGKGWTYFAYDVTSYKNAGMKIRFGLDVASQGALVTGSWNVDDVVVAAAPCP